MDGRRCIVAVHAHPDDESSKGAASMAKYAALGTRTVLVSMTDGAAGDRGPTTERAGDDLATIRAGELDAAVAVLGYAAVHRLGHGDSGMDADRPGAFATLESARIVQELAAIFTAEQPDVVVTYDPDYAAGHPDHQQAHATTVLAFAGYARERAAKLYGIRTHSPTRLDAMHTWLTDHGHPSPYAHTVAAPAADPTTTRIDVAGWIDIARTALRCHRSQVAPDAPWFFAVPTAALEAIHPWDDYQLLDTSIGVVRGRDIEDDLFAGLP